MKLKSRLRRGRFVTLVSSISASGKFPATLDALDHPLPSRQNNELQRQQCRADQTLEKLVSNTETQTAQSAMDEDVAEDLIKRLAQLEEEESTRMHATVKLRKGLWLATNSDRPVNPRCSQENPKIANSGRSSSSRDFQAVVQEERVWQLGKKLGGRIRTQNTWQTNSHAQ